MREHKIVPGVLLFALPILLTIVVYCIFRSLASSISFTEHRDALGAAISSYAGTTIAILIAALTFVIGIRGKNMQKVKAYGYMTSVIILYALTFAELGIVFFMGLFLMATSKQPIALLPSLSIGLSASSMMHISIILFQLLKFSNK
ncbi:biopolymer transporter ExbB [Escherichia albertii]|uniref:biopolymer transporter ExbB n=1 Tax=Escherichia albertii TaxID=208962 RepID=UPI0017F7D2F4|nr:biopolymer transporter ExbB [Escherichia albertii]EFF9448218.1 biopolymer transporter ExbB [Escherichia coli]EEW3330757.1 biopolymer transporter ExbB [Escherichia albertii]EHK1630296.1 biopolymer transporter ExbB [Escherichia coli]EIT7684981.1 biopolymer transporter ExbB [Escherichia coli]MCQ8940258.1 biopolymer transporter ExbB [Escherichia albertii]